ncbi:MAG: hypothetical protein E6K80_04130 [Candidatus Eisenbacteria bacterium]|uniref:Uncharacterized protein n=1 Tax=Eiseniibacteriota bacterium TaxID=2212470 RepID=A0A538U7S0_UNCEI|nr:MAG: hypothetical protein E6K80_04130 [Candidatus Eisenbacteria bacterium]
MTPILYWAAALVAVTLLSPVLRLLIAALAGKQIGQKALAKQPDTIRLERRDLSAWKQPAALRARMDPLLTRGFADAGIHAVGEMPGLVIQLLANAREGFYAAIYEHPRAGHWLDIYSHYQDGTSATFTTARPHGIAPRPGHLSIHCQGVDASSVLDRALAQRPRQAVKPVSIDHAAPVFERAYAEGVAYRKGVGISRGEVVKTALRRAA